MPSSTRAPRTHGPTETRRADARAADRGATIVEIVITIALLGIVVAAVLTAAATGARVSSIDHSAAQVETAIVNAADRLNRAPKGCNYTIYAQAAVQTQGWDPSKVSLEQEYYLPGATAADTGSWAVGDPAAPACPSATPTDLLVQRIRLTIASPDGEIHRTIQVVKSDV